MNAVPRTLVLSTLVLAVGACAPEQEADAEADAEADPQTATRETRADTTVDAVWSHLEEENYAESWDFWPGRSPLYEGTEPHGALLSTYLNDVASDGLAAVRGPAGGELPYGSIVVKENYMPDSTLAAVTVMYKTEGYDAEHGDWWWMKRLADGTIEASGRVPGCIQCHSQAASHDYLVTAAQEAGG